MKSLFQNLMFSCTRNQQEFDPSSREKEKGERERERESEREREREIFVVLFCFMYILDNTRISLKNVRVNI